MLVSCKSTDIPIEPEEPIQEGVEVGSEFPIVAFAVPLEASDFSKLKAMGFNYVHNYELAYGKYDAATKARIQTCLDLAQAHDMKVLLDLDGKYRSQNDESGNPNAEAFVGFKQAVIDFKDHPALGMWYLFDEPEWVGGATPSKLQRYYDFLKTETPNIPVSIGLSTKTEVTQWLPYTWADFTGVTDIVAFDRYPVYGRSFPDPLVADITDFTETVQQRSNNAIMPILQIYNWGDLSSTVASWHAGTLNKEGSEDHPDTWRYPNQTEIRYWCLSSLAQNVQGLMFWSYARSVIWGSEPNWIEDVLGDVTKETSDFFQIVRNGYYYNKITVPGNNKLLAAIWKKGDDGMLILANRSAVVQKLSHNSVLQYLNGNETTWGLTNDLTMDGGELVLQPYEVIVLKTEKK